MSNTKKSISKELLDERYPVTTRKLEYGKISKAYLVDENDPHLLLPNIELIEYLEQAFDFVDGGTLSARTGAEWLSENTGVYFASSTFNNLYRKHRRPFVDGRKIKAAKRPHHFNKLTKAEQTLREEKKRAKQALKRLERSAEKVKKEHEARVYKTKPKTTTNTRPGENVVEEIQKEVQDEKLNVVFQANPGPQEEFLASTEREILYGGAAGGGKSYALLADPMRHFGNKDFRGLLLRRTNDELRELKMKSMELYPRLFEGAKWKEKDSLWVFPSGATLWMTYLDRDEDVTRYQGQSFTWIGFDELTHWPTPFPWNYLRSRLRTTSEESELPLKMRATSNPGGVGHSWVKKMFIDPSPPNKAFWARDEDGEILRKPRLHPNTGEPNPDAGKPLFARKFIPASLYDNPYLVRDDNYENNLLSLSETQKEKLLYGNWDIVEGAAFPEFNRRIHVVEPFDIPHDWRRFRACDYGYASHSAVLWFAVDPGGNLWVYRELYVSRKSPQDLAFLVLQAERHEKIGYGILDSSVWHKRGEGPSPAEVMLAEGCRWKPSDRSPGSRSLGKIRLHELLKVDEFTGEPKLKFFNTCSQVLTDLPSIPNDPDGKDDIDPKYPSDHTYDALRYGIMSRPAPINGPLSTWGSAATTSTYTPADNVFGY